MERLIIVCWKRLVGILFKPIFVILTALLLIIAILNGVIVYQQAINKPRILSVPTPAHPTPVLTITNLNYLADGQPVGLSDGSNAFDLGARNGSTAQQQYYQTLKREGADALKKGNILLARRDWTEATSQRYYPNDAETLIYLENLNVNCYTQRKRPSPLLRIFFSHLIYLCQKMEIVLSCKYKHTTALPHLRAMSDTLKIRFLVY